MGPFGRQGISSIIRHGLGERVAPLTEWEAKRFGPVPAVALVVLLIDQVTKALVTQALGHGRVITALGGLIYLDEVHNTGAAFSLLRSHGVVFILIAAAVMIGVLVFYRRIAASAGIVRLAVGLILGGATGNLIDRIRLGYVVDFIDLRWWPVFNMADSAIVVGVLVLVVWTLLEEKPA